MDKFVIKLARPYLNGIKSPENSDIVNKDQTSKLHQMNPWSKDANEEIEIVEIANETESRKRKQTEIIEVPCKINGNQRPDNSEGINNGRTTNLNQANPWSTEKDKDKSKEKPENDEIETVEIDQNNEHGHKDMNELLNKTNGNKRGNEQTTAKSINGKNNKRLQHFRPIWTQQYSWIIETDKKPFCKICNKILTNNINHIIRHQNTTLHIKKVECLKNQPSISEPEQVVSHITTISQTKTAELKIIMFVIEHNLPFTLVQPIINLVKSITPDSKIAKNLKVAKTKATDTVTTLLYDEGMTELSTILKNQNFSIIIDETTDCSASKCLAVVVRYYHKTSGKVVDRFFNMIELDSFDARSIYEAIINLLNKYKIPIKNLIGFAADNASVMMGHKNGVQKLLQEHNPSLFVIGCTCHSLHLCSSAAAKKLPQKVEILARNIYVFFAHSARRQTEFKELQTMFNVKTHKILRTSSTRWLALENVVTRILEQWIPLKHFFISFELENNDLAHNISSEMNDSSKLYFQFLAYILKLTNDINKEFQAETPRMHLLLPTMKSFMKTILSNFVRLDNVDINEIDFSRKEIFLDIDDVYLGANSEIMIRSGSLTDLEVKPIKLHCVDYYVELCKQIFKRIKFNDPKLAALEGLNPQKLACSVTPLISVFPNLISIDDLTKIENIDIEWRNLINYSFIKRYVDLEEFWCNVFDTKNGMNEKMFPNLEQFISGILCLPHSSAAAERVFSQLNLIKDKKRNCLLVSTINGIMVTKGLLNGLAASDWVPREKLIKDYSKR